MAVSSNRIPGEEATDCRTWKIPDIRGGKILPSAEKEAREKRERESRARGEIVGEPVSNVEIKGPITAAELQRITDQAHQEGYAEGFKQGHGEGLKTGSAEGERLAYAETKERLLKNLNVLEQLIEGLADPFETQTQHLHVFLLKTVMALAESVVRRDLSTDPLDVARLIEQAVNALPKSAADLQIFLHPDDLAMVRELAASKSEHWPLQADSDLSRGGVVVRSKDSLVDYSVESRLAMLGEKFIRGELLEKDTDSNSSSEDKAEKPDGESA